MASKDTMLVFVRAFIDHDYRLNSINHCIILNRIEKEIKMTWEELKEKAKELGSMRTKITDTWILFNGWLKFYEDGTICTETEDSWDAKEIMISYEQMLMIMEALK